MQLLGCIWKGRDYRLRLFLACSLSFCSLRPVRVFFPARLRARSAPKNFRCFSVFAGMALTYQ
jgi:hypothetical protein